MAVQASEQALELHPDMAGALMSPEEFDLAEIDSDDGCRYELTHGVLVVTPIPSEAEADPNEELGHLLRLYRLSHRQGQSLDKTLPERYVRTLVGRRKADRVIWAGLGRRPDPLADVPSVIVEFVSSGRRNRPRDDVDERRECGAVGVREYWVIDRFQRTLTVHGHDVSSSGERTIAEHEVYSTAPVAGFELPLARLLAAADAWK